MKYKKLFFLITFSFFFLQQKSFAQCKISAKYVLSEPDTNGLYSIFLEPTSGTLPYKYIFIKTDERNSPLLNEGDFFRAECNGLMKGSYRCIVVDAKDCSWDVVLEIK